MLEEFLVDLPQLLMEFPKNFLKFSKELPKKFEINSQRNSESPETFFKRVHIGIQKGFLKESIFDFQMKTPKKLSKEFLKEYSKVLPIKIVKLRKQNRKQIVQKIHKNKSQRNCTEIKVMK